MDWNTAAAAIAAIVGQYVKSIKDVPTWIPQVIMLTVGTFVYVAYNPPKVDGWLLVQYIIGALIAGASVNGIASVMGTAIPSLKTDVRSKNGS